MALNKTIGLALLNILFLASCSGSDAPKDENFCKCMELTKELNELSSKILTDGLEDVDAKNMRELREQKSKTCAAYELMGGEELKKLQENCK